MIKFVLQIYFFKAKRLFTVPISPTIIPAIKRTIFKAIFPCRFPILAASPFFLSAPIYMIGGNINIMLDPNTAPATDPTFPMSFQTTAM